MDLKSYAKINLSLIVNKKLKNGFHNIQTLFCMINLFDNISIKKIKDNRDRILFEGPHKKNIKKSNNSIKNLLIILRESKQISDYYEVKINKKIPVFAGLGGGTSNAATIMNFLIKKKISKMLFEKIVGVIGSDLRLFFHNYGFLKDSKKVIKLKKKYKLNFLLVYPKIKCSTKDIFHRVRKYSVKNKFSQRNVKNKSIFIDYIVNSNNDLQPIVEKKYPSIQRLLKNISEEQGCFLSRLTGSGSVCYGLFINEKCSIVALKRLRKKYPKFWFYIAKTI